MARCASKRASLGQWLEQCKCLNGPMKRAFDIAVSATALVCFSIPLLLLIAATRLTSRGAGLFAQERLGRHCKPFTCYKIRTMFADTPVAATHEISAASVTPLGRWLRRTKLDELPQLWNVLRGEMSLVGPRPCLPSQLELIKKRQEKGVFQVRPGITGKAQIAGIDMSDPTLLSQIDADYVQEQTFLGDLVILAQTFNRKARKDRVC